VDKQILSCPEANAPPEHIGRQIVEVRAAQQQVAAQGIVPTPKATYQLGLLALYDRDYEAALGCFRKAADADPEFSDAFEAIACLQQNRAVQDLQAGDEDAARAKLDEARAMAAYTDPLDPQALILRGHIAKTWAEVAHGKGNRDDEQEYYQEAARFFEQVIRLNPDSAAAHNDRGTVAYALGNLDRAIDAYTQAIELAPDYTAAYHDLAEAFEAKMGADQARSVEWAQSALEMWRQTYRLARNDPIFTKDDVVCIDRRIRSLEERLK
jgi:tetratricopeptide (TPR) repeat protein